MNVHPAGLSNKTIRRVTEDTWTEVWLHFAEDSPVEVNIKLFNRPIDPIRVAELQAFVTALRSLPPEISSDTEAEDTPQIQALLTDVAQLVKRDMSR